MCFSQLLKSIPSLAIAARDIHSPVFRTKLYLGVLTRRPSIWHGFGTPAYIGQQTKVGEVPNLGQNLPICDLG